MNFEKRQREADCVDESEIVLNQHVLVSMVCQEIGKKVPLKMLKLTLPAINLLITTFRWDFIGSFFCVRVPGIISKPKNKNTASRKKIFIKFYIRKWTFNNARTNNIVTTFQKKC